MDHKLFIHSPVSGHPGCFHVLAVVSSALSIGVQVSSSFVVFSECMPSSGIFGSYGSFILSFERKVPYCSPQWLYQFTLPSTVQEVSLFSTSSPAFIFCRYFDEGL